MSDRSGHCFFVDEDLVDGIDMPPLLDGAPKTECLFCPSKPGQGVMRLAVDGCFALKQVCSIISNPISQARTF